MGDHRHPRKKDNVSEIVDMHSVFEKSTCVNTPGIFSLFFQEYLKNSEPEFRYDPVRKSVIPTNSINPIVLLYLPLV